MWLPASPECRGLSTYDFDEALVEAVVGDETRRKELVNNGGVGVLGYLLYQTVRTAGARRRYREKRTKRVGIAIADAVGR